MPRDSLMVLPYAPASPRGWRGWRGWATAPGCGFILDMLLGIGMIGSYAHIKWAIFAGLAVGVASGLAARPFPLLAALAALAGGIVTVITCMSVIVIYQVHVGHWPIRDPETIAHYGSAEQAALRVGIILLPAVCGPCALVAALASYIKRRAA